MKKIIVSIAQRVTDWKRLFIEKNCLEGLTEEARWVDIMKQVALNPLELFHITAEASGKIGPFSVEEVLYLQRLPCYNIIVSFLPQIDTNMPDGHQFHIGTDKDTYNVCLIYHKKSLNIFECYIIEPEISEVMKTDLLISYFDIGTVACISFVKDIPEHFKTN